MIPPIGTSVRYHCRDEVEFKRLGGYRLPDEDPRVMTVRALVEKSSPSGRLDLRVTLCGAPTAVILTQVPQDVSGLRFPEGTPGTWHLISA